MYTDINARFPENNELAYTEDIQDIIRSLDRLFNTRPGTIPFNRSYGSSVYSLLFESSNIDEYQIEMLLFQDIKTFEPRVQLGVSDITIRRIDEHSFSINVQFSIPALNYAMASVSSTISE